MKFILSIIIYLLTGIISAQHIVIFIDNISSKAATLSFLEGEKFTVIDSINYNSDGSFSFSGKSLHTGFYRLSFEKSKWVDFVYNGKDINIQTDASNILDNMKVFMSESNRIYYKFVILNKAYKTKTELLQLILARYPKDDEYYNTTIDRLNLLQSEYVEFVNIASQKDPLSFIARYIRSAQIPVVDISIPMEEKLTYLKSNALDNVNFNDAELIYSDCFSNKSIEYLMYYRNPQLPKGLLEKEFMSAVDTILNKAKVNVLVYQHVTEYLIDGFKKFGFDTIIDYILENYVIKDDLCLDEKLESSIDRRIRQAKLLKIGSTVPNIILPDQSGKNITLDKIGKQRTLIVFYASWCPHCKELLPQIDELYKKQGTVNMEVLAVSMDSTKTDWNTYIEENNFTWMNVCDTKGWSGKAANDYHIYATPTMFLVDRERVIIAKPKSIDELNNIF